MPVYTVASKKPLAQSTMNALADALTDAHCHVTGAPAEFMNVIFMTGYGLRGSARISVNANIRIGGNRGKEILDALNSQILEQVAKVIMLPQKNVAIRLIGFQPGWIMEGGLILPDPVDEDDWLARKKAKWQG